MKYPLDVLLDENGEITIHRSHLVVEAETQEEAHDKAIAQLKKEYPKAAIAITAARQIDA